VSAVAARAAVVGTVSGDVGKGVHGPEAPVVEYAMTAVAGPLVLRHRAVELSESPEKPVVSAQKAMPSLAADGGEKMPGEDEPSCVANPAGVPL
jgi:hypothetical protein